MWRGCHGEHSTLQIMAFASGLGRGRACFVPERTPWPLWTWSELPRPRFLLPVGLPLPPVSFAFAARNHRARNQTGIHAASTRRGSGVVLRPVTIFGCSLSSSVCPHCMRQVSTQRARFGRLSTTETTEELHCRTRREIRKGTRWKTMGATCRTHGVERESQGTRQLRLRVSPSLR